MNTIVSSQDNALWRTFGLALGAEPRRDYLVLRGASGLDHPVQSLSVDDKGKRLIIVSGDPNPRITALMQADVQATMPSTRVLVARPVVFDLGVLARRFLPDEKSGELTFKELKARLDEVDKNRWAAGTLASVEKAMMNTTLPALTQIVEMLRQLACMDWKDLFEGTTEEDGMLHLAPLRKVDNMAVDVQHGICPVPVYEFQESDWDLFTSGVRIEEARERLKQLGVFQYFFPPADHLVLGAIDRQVANADDIATIVDSAPTLGHPLGELELVDRMSDIPTLIEEFKALGYLVESDFSFEIGPAGTTIRGNVRTRPREALLGKILNRITVNANVSLSPKDLFPPGSH